ncbi:MAG TPA: hypothetical protein VLJ38_12205 [Polyangiaceae bacterium]|nr:hypothetical protein [Polyangiaceae bacterium]
MSFFANLLRRGIGEVPNLGGRALPLVSPVREEERFIAAPASQAVSQNAPAGDLVSRKASAPFVAPAPVVAFPARVAAPPAPGDVPPPRAVIAEESVARESVAPIARPVMPANLQAAAPAKPAQSLLSPPPFSPLAGATEASELTDAPASQGVPLVVATPLRTLVVRETMRELVERSVPAVATEPAVSPAGGAAPLKRGPREAPSPLATPPSAAARDLRSATRAALRPEAEATPRYEPAPPLVAPAAQAEVRIERIEILAESTPAPSVEPAPAPRGFDAYLFARSYVRRAR